MLKSASKYTEAKMAYSIIQPPFSLKFRQMSKPELRSYLEWFLKVLPERLVALEWTIRGSSEYSSWKVNYSPNSLAPLGNWFAGQIETRKRTKEEIEAMSLRLNYSVEGSSQELTNRSFSLAVDVGMYFGQVILENHPGTSWDQLLDNKRYADYGQPIIVGLGKVPLNPVRIAVTLAYAIAGGKPDGTRLRAIYKIWSKMPK
jgi:hypothetical protein